MSILLPFQYFRAVAQAAWLARQRISMKFLTLREQTPVNAHPLVTSHLNNASSCNPVTDLLSVKIGKNVTSSGRMRHLRSESFSGPSADASRLTKTLVPQSAMLFCEVGQQ
jgi:hypothetical protein